MGENSETLDDITRADRFSYWFAGRFRDFAGKESKLPFDQHFMKALVAPRALLTTDALGDLWANPYGTQVTQTVAKEVFKFLGAGEKIGMHFRQGGHAQNEEDFRALVDFADKVFYGREVERKFGPAFKISDN
jgi:endo-1,4-beta-xylanase